MIRYCEKRLANGYATCLQRKRRYRRFLGLDRRYSKNYGVRLLENLKRSREQGLAVFLEREKAQGTCPQRGGVICLRDRRRSGCGKQNEGFGNPHAKEGSS